MVYYEYKKPDQLNQFEFQPQLISISYAKENCSR